MRHEQASAGSSEAHALPVPADFPPRRLSWRRAGPWRLVFLGWIPDQERTREALCTLANGNVGMRGAAE